MATDTYSTPGADTWTVPVGVTSVVIECWGGGGGGNPGSGARGGTGGGGGAYSLATVAVTAGHIYSLTVGAGGAGVTPTNGGDSSVTSPAPAVVCLAKGGTAGPSGSTGGAGGAAASGTGDTKYSGGNGGGQDADEAGGGGGSSAGTASAGNNGSSNSGTTGGAGGAAVTGGGAGGAGGNTGNAGTNGSAPGGGGGGGAKGGSTDGGTGGDGKVTFTYTVTGVIPDYPPTQEGQWSGAHNWQRRRKIPSGRGGAFMEWFDPFYTEPETIHIDKWAPIYPAAIAGKQWRPEGGETFTIIPTEPDVVEHGWEFALTQVQRRHTDKYRRLFGTLMIPQVQDPLVTSYLTIVGETTIEPAYKGTYRVIPAYLGETTFNLEGEE